MIKIILADDHPVVRDGLRAVVERKARDIEIIGEATNGKEVLEMAQHRPADVYILDVAMPILNGIEAAERLMKMDPKSKIIMLSIHDEKTFVEKALECGAQGYILKESATEEMIHATYEVYQGRQFLSPGVSKFIVRRVSGKRRHYRRYKEIATFTRREKEILQLIGEGFTNKQIARQLNISFNTVHGHRNHIMAKLGIHKQADLIRYAIKEGISKL
jgi:two-component system response regulator NreC